MFELKREEGLFILSMVNGENRFNLTTLALLNSKLDEVLQAAADGPAGLIVVGDGKYWSNGIDLEWLSGAGPEDAGRFVATLNHLFGRLLTFPLPTVAALNGHAFAAGAMLALAADYRVMRADRGWFCLPEVDIRIPFHPAMMALNRCKLSGPALRDAVLGGRRFVAAEAQAAGIVDVTCPLEELLDRAKDMARPLSTKDRKLFAQMKKDLYGPVALQLTAELDGMG